MDAKGLIRSLAEELDDEANAASDLWSWLPSYAKAQEEHGDYAHSMQPTVAEIMYEACDVLASSKQENDDG